MKRILLIGAGHAHLAALRELARKAVYGMRITLVAPEPQQVYSGMLPGLIAGHYGLEEVLLSVSRIAALAYAEYVRGSVDSLDLANRVARLADGTELRYDVLSLNLGSRVGEGFEGAMQNAVAIKPYEEFVRRLHGERFARVAVIGAGAAGMEIAMALRHLGAAVTLYSEQATVHPALLDRAVPAMRRTGVDFRPGMAVDAIEAGPVVVSGGSRQAFDLVLLATWAVAPALPREAGLATDSRGFALVDSSLRSVSHPEVFAAGDCATLRDAPHPKSGVYAVRHGAVLYENLVRLVSGMPLKEYRPQAKALTLLSCGARYAIAQRGGWSTEGDWVWRWKNRVDRKWLRSLEGH